METAITLWGAIICFVSGLVIGALSNKTGAQPNIKERPPDVYNIGDRFFCIRQCERKPDGSIILCDLPILKMYRNKEIIHIVVGIEQE